MASFEQNIAGFFLEVFEPSLIYASAAGVAQLIAITIVPILIILSLLIRANAEVIDSMSGKGKWAELVPSIIIVAIGLSIYFPAFYLVVDFGKSVRPFFGGNTGFMEITNTMAGIAAETEMNWSDISITNAIASLPLIVSYSLFLLSYLALLIATIFMSIAHAVIYGIVFVWGLIAFAVFPSKKINLFKGWGIAFAILLVWPAIEGLLFYLESVMLLDGLESIRSRFSGGESKILQRNYIYLVWFALNMLMLATSLSSIYITQSLITNSGQIAGTILPFAAAGAATAAGVVKSMYAGGNKVKGGIDSKLEEKGITPANMASKAGSSAISGASALAEKLKPTPKEKPKPLGYGKLGKGKEDSKDTFSPMSPAGGSGTSASKIAKPANEHKPKSTSSDDENRKQSSKKESGSDNKGSKASSAIKSGTVKNAFGESGSQLPPDEGSGGSKSSNSDLSPEQRKARKGVFINKNKPTKK